ncbi:MAG: L-threonylcarbamoyladenylate synthase [Thermodesulfobacteriota bacterium]|nr:L-threonylcarbamoyladenylate synthase [Thermodesulfobacteriota bacterium]
MTGCGNNYRTIDPDFPDADLIGEACRVVANGGVVAFPAAAIYGLAADAFKPQAVAKVRKMKNRPATNPILLLVKDRQVVNELAADISPPAVCIMDRFWPGGVTLVFNASTGLPVHLASPDSTIGIRLPSHPVAQALVLQCPRPLTGTSANIAGQGPYTEADRLNDVLASRPDLILDAGPLRGGVGSTVVDVTVSPPVILREGIVPASLIFDTLAHL